MPLYSTLTECVNAAGAQYATDPTSDLSRALEAFATSLYADTVNATFPLAEAARPWIERGLLFAGFLDRDPDFVYSTSVSFRETGSQACALYATARGVIGLPV